MYNNITGNEYVVNKETDKQLHYFAMNHNVMDIMESKGMSDFDYKLFMVICSEMSFNSIFGVFNRYTEYSLAQRMKVDKTIIRRRLDAFEKVKLIKRINQSPIILQVIETPRKLKIIESIDELMLYVLQNENEFNFDDIRFLKLAKAFYKEHLGTDNPSQLKLIKDRLRQSVATQNQSNTPAPVQQPATTQKPSINNINKAIVKGELPKHIEPDETDKNGDFDPFFGNDAQ